VWGGFRREKSRLHKDRANPRQKVDYSADLIISKEANGKNKHVTRYIERGLVLLLLMRLLLGPPDGDGGKSCSMNRD